MEEDPNYSLVEYMGGHSGHRCGYCKSPNTNYNRGMWAHRMTVGHYQSLIDRGWRRSGKYCYKPTMNLTCCPHYAIKCDPLNFKPTKSQKKVLKRMHHFLSHGSTKVESNVNISEEKDDSVCVKEEVVVKAKTPLKEDFAQIQKSLREIKKMNSSDNCTAIKVSAKQEVDELELSQESQNSILDTKSTSSIAGPDPMKPPCKKAKVIRRERFKAKNLTANAPKKNIKNAPKSLEDYLNEPLPDNPAHRLELRLVPCIPRSKRFTDSFQDSYNVFRLYQMGIHKEIEEDCDVGQFRNFLVDSPFMHWTPSDGPPQGFGSFHHQYWLDGRLIAIGVVDILPNCLSSVYLFYDPAFSFLSLGTYAALREIALAKELYSHLASIRWYYMGYYIHSCPKMKYKGAFYPSYLLCPETYSWIEIERCVPKLDASKYSRLNENSDAVDTLCNINMRKVLCFYDGRPIHYGDYQLLEGTSSTEDEEVKEYATLTGSACCHSMLLYRG